MMINQKVGNLVQHQRPKKVSKVNVDSVRKTRQQNAASQPSGRGDWLLSTNSCRWSALPGRGLRRPDEP